MTLFGINLNLNTRIIDNQKDLSSVLTEKILKRKDEREKFQIFLNSKLDDGITVFESICNKAKETSEQNNDEVPNEILVNFVTNKLKQVDLYKQLTRQIIEEINPEFALLHKKIDKEKFDGKVPFGYPNANKLAEGLLQAKIKDSITNQTRLDYLTENKIEEKIREMTREMFFAINNGSKDKQILQFLNIRFELLSQKSIEETKSDKVKRILLDSIINGTKVTIYHPKCMRFCYPNGDSLEIIDHIGDHTIKTKDGNDYFLPGEDQHLSQLSEIKKILETNGVNVSFVVLVMDQDLDNCFPRDGGGIISPENITKAESDGKIYYSKLKEILAKKGINVLTQTEYFNNAGQLGEYQKKKNERISSLKKGNLIKENFVEERVNYFYESKRKIFKNPPNRDFARLRVILEMASMLSLDILSDIETNSILIAENIFSMKGLIARGNIPSIFFDLSS